MSADSSNDLNHAILNLTEAEKRAYAYLFKQADSDQLGVVTGERAVAFFEKSQVSPNILGEIWQIADSENRGLLTKPGFCMVLRLIGHYQAGREPSAELAFKPAPIPKFEGIAIPGAPANVVQPQLSGQGPIRVPALEPQKVQQYSSLFERSGAQDGLLDGGTAKSIFERAGLPNEVLGKMWSLSDRQQRGALDQTEFIVAMHLLTSMKMRAMTALPNTLPPGLYEAAARRGAPLLPGSRGGPGARPPPPGRIPQQLPAGSAGAPPRTQSPLARSPGGYGTPPPQSAQTTGVSWLITPAEKARYDQFFATIDTQGRGVITGEQAVGFFSDSRLPEDTLASIWDLSDINSEGQLNRDEFAVAMYLIRQQRSSQNPPPLPPFLPSALVPPSMRQQQQSQQSTAPAFDNAAHSTNMPKSAADDLFGLDEPSPPRPQPPAFQLIQPQGTGASATRDPLGGSAPESPSSPQRFQPQPTQPPGLASNMFKPFMPTSAFGASLAQQHTGGSTSSSQRGSQLPGQPAQPSHLHTATTAAENDLLGDNETHAEESSQLNSDTTELANMSSQIGNLRAHMEGTQQKKFATQRDLTATQNQKRDLEVRLKQFRAQYETEVRTVKELEEQLAASKEGAKKLQQELAMLEGAYQDLQTQHQSVAQQLGADQQENANLKQRISQINAEVVRLKPEIEKMKLNARQQRGMVSINKKQLATSEGERDRLNREKADPEREAREGEEAARNAPQEEESHFGRDAGIAAGVAAVGTAAFGGYEAGQDRQGGGITGDAVKSPGASSTLSSMNPFFRKASAEGTAQRAASPPAGTSGTGAPTPSAFDALFSPSAAFAPPGQAGSRTGTPPPTSFTGRSIPQSSTGGSAAAAAGPSGLGGMTDSVQSVSSVGEPTPSATPPLSGSDQAKESPVAAQEPAHSIPAPPESRQFTPSQLPLTGLPDRTKLGDDVDSTKVMPPASKAGGMGTPRDGLEGATDSLPGAFPVEESTSTAPEAPTEEPAAAQPPAAAKDDFDSAFAGFGEGEKAKGGEDPFAPAADVGQQQTRGFSGDFATARIQGAEADEQSSDDDEGPEEIGQKRYRFDDNFGAAGAAPPRHGAAELSPPPEVNATPTAWLAAESTATEPANVAGARPAVHAAESAARDLPTMSAQKPPPSYQDSNEPSHGGTGERTESNRFPPEFGGLLPSREDPTSLRPPPNEPPSITEQAVMDDKENEILQYAAPERSGTVPSSLYAHTVPQTPSTADVYHDASSRPISSVTDAYPAQQQQQAPKNAFDDFDDLSDAKEADNSVSGFDFGGFGNGDQGAQEFDAAFDSPAASMTNTMTSSQQTPVPSVRQLDGFHSGFGQAQSSSSPFDSMTSSGAGAGGQSSVQQTPQNVQHDWDAIFSGLDNSEDVGTSFGGKSNDPWVTPAASGATANGDASAAKTPTNITPTTTKAAQMGRAITPGTEHDDPILKRLTGMGYPRAEALNALEMYDYDINKAVDHLTSS